MSRKNNTKSTNPRDEATSERSLSVASEKGSQVAHKKGKKQPKRNISIQKKQTVNRGRNTLNNRMEKLCCLLIGEQRSQELVYMVEVFQYMRGRERETVELVTSKWLGKGFEDGLSNQHIVRRAMAIDAMALVSYEMEFFRSQYLAVFLLDLTIGDRIGIFAEEDHYSIDEAMLVAMFSATKYCELQPTDLQSLVMLFRTNIKDSEVIKLEEKNLKRMDYRLNIDSEQEFLSVYTALLRLSDRDRYVCQYLLEVGLFNPLLIRELPSRKAAAAVYLMYHLLYMQNTRECFPNPLKVFTGYTSADIKQLAKEYLKTLIFSKQNEFTGVRIKYELDLYHKVGLLI